MAREEKSEEKKEKPKEKKAERGGKRVRTGRKHSGTKKYKFYSSKGDALERRKACPRCGAGVFLGVHKDRVYCGRCYYTEFSKRA